MVVEGYIIFVGFLLLLDIFIVAYTLWTRHQIATGITKISDALDKLTLLTEVTVKEKYGIILTKKKENKDAE